MIIWQVSKQHGDISPFHFFSFLFPSLSLYHIQSKPCVNTCLNIVLLRIFLIQQVPGLYYATLSERNLPSANYCMSLEHYRVPTSWGKFNQLRDYLFYITQNYYFKTFSIFHSHGKPSRLFLIKIQVSKSPLCFWNFQFPALNPLNLVNCPETHVFDFSDLYTKWRVLAISFLRYSFFLLVSCLTPYSGARTFPKSPFVNASTLFGFKQPQLCVIQALLQQPLVVQRSSWQDVIRMCSPAL